jgi:hypothetical protein
MIAPMAGSMVFVSAGLIPGPGLARNFTDRA